MRQIHPIVLAQMFHEMDRSFRKGTGRPAMTGWGGLSMVMRDAILKLVLFTLDHPELPPHVHHGAWCRWLTQERWSPGDRSDPATKKHSWLRPWTDLHETDRYFLTAFAMFLRTLRPTIIGYPAVDDPSDLEAAVEKAAG